MIKCVFLILKTYIDLLCHFAKCQVNRNKIAFQHNFLFVKKIDVNLNVLTLLEMNI